MTSGAVVTTAFDEEAHSANVGMSYQVTEASSLGAKLGYTLILHEDELWGSSVLNTNTIGASVTYGWTVGQRLSFQAAVGGYRSEDTAQSTPSKSSLIPGAVPVSTDGDTTTDLSADVSLTRNDVTGTFITGLTRGISSLAGLGRVMTLDSNHDGIPDDSNGDGTADRVVEPLGSTTRTTLYGSYNYRLGQRSNLTFSANATRSDESQSSGSLTAFGIGSSYNFRFAPWGGVQAGYTYTEQTSSGEADLQGREFTNNTAMLGLFVSTPW